MLRLETMPYSQVLVLTPEGSHYLLNLCGKHDEHLRMIEHSLGVAIKYRGYSFFISGIREAVQKACLALKELYQEAQKQRTLLPSAVHLYLQTSSRGDAMEVRTKRSGIVSARGKNQIHYITHILKEDINFGIGPAGTGKTYLAVACAVHALETERVSRIILVRPIVEAGEKLGFLPGDLAQKVHPYLRPLYDALYELLGFDQVTQLMERNIIELAPLAYMRGRSLNDSFIILDEGQNTTIDQMKMFLTRMGFHSKAVITGDITQIDLANRKESGLIHAAAVLQDVKGVSFTRFQTSDIVRHPLVARIVEAYESFDNTKEVAPKPQVNH